MPNPTRSVQTKQASVRSKILQRVQNIPPQQATLMLEEILHRVQDLSLGVVLLKPIHSRISNIHAMRNEAQVFSKMDSNIK